MSLCNKTVSEFMAILGSDSPAPGGGTVSALSGEAGASLLKMVAGLTMGKKKYADYQSESEDILKGANRAAIKFEDLAQKDSESFDGVTAVFKMPKDTAEEKLARKAAMEEALKACVMPPLEVMELSADTLCQMVPAVKFLNQSALSDLGVAALSLKTALSGAYMNVLINLQGITDMEFKKKYFAKSEKVHKIGTLYAEEIYNGVLHYLSEDVKKSIL